MKAQAKSRSHGTYGRGNGEVGVRIPPLSVGYYDSVASQYFSNEFHTSLKEAYVFASVHYSLVKMLQWDKPTHESAEERI
jgi:trehalose/maltose hydrolase-like predicted phosphorylase